MTVIQRGRGGGVGYLTMAKKWVAIVTQWPDDMYILDVVAYIGI